MTDAQKLALIRSVARVLEHPSLVLGDSVEDALSRAEILVKKLSVEYDFRPKAPDWTMHD